MAMTHQDADGAKVREVVLDARALGETYDEAAATEAIEESASRLGITLNVCEMSQAVMDLMDS